MEKFKKHLARAIEISMFCAFVIGTALAIADIFGGLEALPKLRDAFPKIMLLLVGLLGSSVILQYWLSIKDIERNTSESAKTIRNVEQVLKASDELCYPTRLLINRNDMVKALLDALDKAPPSAQVDVTHFEKLLGAQYDVGEGGVEEFFMDRWKTKVRSGAIQVRQLVHVCTACDLDEVAGRINEFSECQNYSLNIIYGPPPVPYIDFITIPGHWACIDLSTDSGQPFRSSIGIEFLNPKFADALCKYFEIWWSRFSTPVKIKNKIVCEELYRMRAVLHDTAILWTGTRRIGEFSLLYQKDESVQRLIDVILQTVRHTHDPAAIGVFGPSFSGIMSEAATKLPSIVSGGKIVERAYVETILMNIVKSAGAESNIQAVSYDPDQQHFWESAFGERFLAANADAVGRGAYLSRVFILADRQFRDVKNTCSFLRKQVNAGVSAYYVEAEKVSQEMRRDFIVRDGSIAFEMDVSADPTPVKKGMLYVTRELALQRADIFEALLKISAEFKENQKTL